MSLQRAHRRVHPPNHDAKPQKHGHCENQCHDDRELSNPGLSNLQTHHFQRFLLIFATHKGDSLFRRPNVYGLNLPPSPKKVCKVASRGVGPSASGIRTVRNEHVGRRFLFWNSLCDVYEKREVSAERSREPVVVLYEHTPNSSDGRNAVARARDERN